MAWIKVLAPLVPKGDGRTVKPEPKPNLGRSVHLPTLVPDWETEKAKGVNAIAIWASQHLNIEIGIG